MSAPINLTPAEADTDLLKAMDEAKSIISGVRNVRLSKNIPQKQPMNLMIVGKWTNPFKSIVEKLGGLESITDADAKDPAAASFMVGTTEYCVPLEGAINVEEEIKKLQAELDYAIGFLKSVEKKLSNERFDAHAPKAVVAA